MAEEDADMTQRLQPKCTLCLDDFVEPRRLPCAATHVFCTKCIFLVTQLKSEDGEFRCPARSPNCTAFHKVPAKGLDGIRKTFPLVLQSSKKREDQEEKTTGAAKQDEKPSYQSYCKETGHHEKEIVLYCKNHDKLVCLLCITGPHAKCELLQLEEEVKHQKRKIKELIEEIKEYKTDLKKYTDETKKSFKASERDIQELEDKVEASYHDLQAVLVAMKAETMNIIECIREGRKCHEVSSAQNERMEKVDQLSLNCYSVEEETELCLLMELALELQSSWKRVAKEKLPVFDWQYAYREQEKRADNMIGRVVCNEKVSENLIQVKLSGELPLVADIQTVGGSSGEISGILDIGAELLVTRRNANTINVYDSTDGKSITSICVPELSDPFGGLVRVNEDAKEDIELVIPDFGKRFHLITVNRQWQLARHEKRSVPYRPAGVTLYKDGTTMELIVVDCDNAKLHVCNKQGTEQRAIQINCVSNRQCALKVEGGYVVGGGNYLVWVNNNGNEIRRYSSQLNNAYKLIGDRDKKILVADKDKHSVYEVDNQARLVRTLAEPKDGVKSPFCLHLATNGKLYISSGSNKIKVLQYCDQDTAHCHTVNISQSVEANLNKWAKK